MAKKHTETEYTHVKHGFTPVFDENSRILILGSLPSVRSRQNGFYYGHPQNRFWRLIAKLLGCSVPQSVEEKRSLLLKNRIALWDVIDECDIIGSSDASIKNVTPTELSRIFEKCAIEAVFANGAAAARLYEKLQKPHMGRDITLLPSTSAANAAWNMERLEQTWRIILPYLDMDKKA